MQSPMRVLGAVRAMRGLSAALCRSPLMSVVCGRRLMLVSHGPISAFHSSATAWSKNKKGGKAGKGDDEIVDVKLPELKGYEKSMDGTLNWVTNEFAKIKVGRVTADLFNNLAVESYGTVGKAGQVTLKSNTKLVVALYDPVMGKAVADAIRKCGLNLNPTIEGSNVLATIPRPSKESRDAMVKTAQKLAEKAKTDIRNVRKDCMDTIKKCKGGVSEDEIKRFTKDAEALTEKKLDKVSQLIKAKENEINTSD